MDRIHRDKMAAVANLLGVKLGQRFKTNNSGDTWIKITHTGVIAIHQGTVYDARHSMLQDLLIGKERITEVEA